MFNRKIEIRLVRDKKVTTEETPVKEDPVDYIAIANEAGKKILIGTLITIAATTILTTASQIIVNALNTPNN